MKDNVLICCNVLLFIYFRYLYTNFAELFGGGGQWGRNPGEKGPEVGGKRDEAERDAGVMRGREAGEE